MRNIRLVARLDIKGLNVIKGINLEGLRKVGIPSELALNYYLQGIDEIIYMDSVASLYGRNHLSEIVKEAVKNIFVPLTVGGGIRSLADVGNILRSGADKVSINTAAIKNPKLISEVANKYGSQCMITSIEAKKNGPSSWEAYTDNGREHTGFDVLEWAKKAESLGAGEILLTSVDQEGTGKGFDLELINKVSNLVSIPVIASGGMGVSQDLIDVVKVGNADAVAMANVLHFQKINISDLRKEAFLNSIEVRHFEKA
jgi:cyclase